MKAASSTIARFVYLKVLTGIVFFATPAQGRPEAPDMFCKTYPKAPACKVQSVPCDYCHDSAPPALNPYGASLQMILRQGATTYLSPADFDSLLPAALHAVESMDSDGDGRANSDEITAGSLPGDASSPSEAGFLPASASAAAVNAGNFVVPAGFDALSTLKRIHRDFCGQSLPLAGLETFNNLLDGAKVQALHDHLDKCLESEYWLGKDGVVWQLGHMKIRPLGAVKDGEDPGTFPLADYYDDYALFVYTQTGGHDARDILLADYFVERSPAPTTYTKVENIIPTGTGPQAIYGRIFGGQEFVATPKRQGILTTGWSLGFFTMFSALPRNLASQAYRAYLGCDIAKLECLEPVAGEPADYDAKGVEQETCATCHSTLDPLSYPFKVYNGLSSNVAISPPLIPITYAPDRIAIAFAGLSPNVTDMPEAGMIFGQRVADLKEWAEVAANSPQFAGKIVADYWSLLVGHDPLPAEQPVLTALAADLMGKDAYSVNALLHELIMTEAYCVP